MVIISVLFVTIGLYIIILLIMYLFQEKMLFKQTKFPQNFPYHYEYPFDEINWIMTDGIKINGLHFKVRNPKGVIIFFHGNTGHMGRSGNYFKRVAHCGYDVVMYDYRGYGKSGGTITKETLYSDAEHVYDWVQQQYPHHKIVLHGLSLGAHIACYIASKKNPDYLLLETPFRSLINAAKYQYPFVPMHLILRYNLDSTAFLQHVHCPIHVFHGNKDKVVPLKEALSILEYSDAKITVFKGGTHKNIHEFAEYKAILHNILDKI